MTPLESMDEGDLLCHALGHRWRCVAARAGVAGGARVWDWALECTDGCGSRATEWRDKFGFRLPGTRRHYYPTPKYRESGGYARNEYALELQRRSVRIGRKEAS